MNIFLCGQRSFGAAVLDELLARGHNIVGVSPAPRGEKKDKLEVEAIRKRVPVISDGEKLSFLDYERGFERVLGRCKFYYL